MASSTLVAACPVVPAAMMSRCPAPVPNVRAAGRYLSRGLQRRLIAGGPGSSSQTEQVGTCEPHVQLVQRLSSV